MGSFCYLLQEATKANPIMKILGPVLWQIGFGGIVGWGVGFFTKKIAKIIIIAAALVFICIQILIHFGYIPGIEWARLGKDITNAIDKNFLNTVWNLLVNNLPFAGSFAVFFLIGLKKG